MRLVGADVRTIPELIGNPRQIDGTGVSALIDPKSAATVINGRAAWQQRVSGGRPSVVGERSEQEIDRPGRTDSTDLVAWEKSEEMKRGLRMFEKIVPKAFEAFAVNRSRPNQNFPRRSSP